MLLFKTEDLNSAYFSQTEKLLCKYPSCPAPDTPTLAWLVAASDPTVNQETEPRVLKNSTTQFQNPFSILTLQKSENTPFYSHDSKYLINKHVCNFLQTHYRDALTAALPHSDDRNEAGVGRKQAVLNLINVSGVQVRTSSRNSCS